MNQIILSGNLCKDPELRKTMSGTYVGSASIAVTKGKNQDGEYETDFFDLKFFDKQADYAAKNLRKGDKVLVTGKIQFYDYVNRDQVKVTRVEVLVSSVEMLVKKNSEDRTAKEDDKPAEEPAPSLGEMSNEEGTELDSIEISDDDLPF